MSDSPFQTPQHHATLFISNNRKEKASSLWKELQTLSPAHIFFDQTVLDIGTARTIITWANTPYHEEKIALISFHTAGVDAQNAMLKILEEPQAGVKFILITTSTSNLLGTVLSRLHHIDTEHNDIATQTKKNIKEFLQTPSTERMNLAYIKKLLTKVDEEDRKDRESTKSFILDLASELNHLRVDPKYITETIEMAAYSSDPSASGKSILAYLSLLLPQVVV